jgi:hypothetical protein
MLGIFVFMFDLAFLTISPIGMGSRLNSESTEHTLEKEEFMESYTVLLGAQASSEFPAPIKFSKL